MTLPGLPQASKNTRRLVRELAAKAHERELAVALGHLHDAFDGWRNGRMGAFELNERIRRFNNGPSRDLYNTYSEVDPAMLVAHAFVRHQASCMRRGSCSNASFIL